MSKPDRFEDEHEAVWRPLTKEDWFAMGRDGIGVMNLPVRVVEDSEWPRERPIVWPVGAQIPIKEEEEVADADATLEARASRSNPEE